MNALELNNISKSYSGKLALKGVNFLLEEGVVAGLVGPNGAGKTTLFSTIAGFISPDQGEVKIFGRPLNSLDSLNGLVSILPQDARFQKGISIKRQLQWYSKLMGLGEKEGYEETERVLKLVDLLKAAEKEGDQLSHGMHKRMAVAQAFIANPKIILLDEPTSGLDPANARQIRNVITRQKGKQSFLVSSHNLDEIADLCDFVVILDKGKVVESSSMSAFVKEESLITVSLSEIPNKSQITSLETMDFVKSIKLSEDGQRLAIFISENYTEDPAILASLAVKLAEVQVKFTGMSKGSTLEERFLEITE
ncbi:MAG: ABC transporter [bacterium]|nr:MAG: ABC transporter [bacterium]